MTNNLESLGVFKDFTDSSIKSVFQTKHKGIIECTLLFNKPDHDVLCVPTHHFCNLGCKMCHLTNKGLNKHMNPIKIEHFLEALIKSLCINVEDRHIDYENLSRRTAKKKLLISFMGVGEPLLNLSLIENLFLSEEMLKGLLGYDEVGYAISTMMPNQCIDDLAHLVSKYNKPLKLHFSMHSPFDKERFDLIPATKVSVEEALSNLIKYSEIIRNNTTIIEKYAHFHSTLDPIEIHYTLIKERNDTQEHLKETIKLLTRYPITIKFIRFNPIGDLERSNVEIEWVSQISKAIPNIRVKTYSPPGREIGSSCGEFTKHYYHESIETKEQLQEFKVWEEHHKIYENQRKDYIAWDEYYMGIALLSAQRSKDPSTQVGACIVSAENKILSVGYNGTPNGIHDESFNWARNGDYLNTKYAYVVHAEMNAVLNFLGDTSLMNNSVLYVTLFPCNECAKFIVQSGIKKIIYLSDKYESSESTIVAKKIFDRCNIKYEKYIPKNKKLILEYV